MLAARRDCSRESGSRRLTARGIVIAATPVERRKATLLVVDDEEPNRSLLEALLAPQGYNIVTASDGQMAVKRLEQGGIDLVLLDLMMPVMDGIEVCRYVRGELGDELLPIIFTTSRRDRESRVRAKEAGADDFLLKPVDSFELMVRVENLLRVRTYYQLVAEQSVALERELEIATSKLMHMERLSTVGSLASGVGHELSNLATIQRGAVDLIQDALSKQQPVDPRYFAGLERVTDHLTHHATRLLHLGGSGRGHQEVLDLGQVVREAVELVAGTGRTKHARISADIPEASVRVRSVRMHVEQVLFNLVLNASDALERIADRPRTIRVQVEPCDPLGRARMHVIDSGSGIAPEDLDRVFDPYFTTKPPERGTGLGLTLVKHIVEAGGGRIVVLSKIDEGTTVSVDFPAVGQDE